MITTKNNYGWKPDLPDFRDYKFTPITLIAPPSVDLSTTTFPVFDQGQLGSCTANAVASAYFKDCLKQRIKNPGTTSRLFLYYNTRQIEGTTNYDAGATIRNTIKSIAKQGACQEKVWRYIIPNFRTKPPTQAYADALKHQAVVYRAVSQALPQLKACLNQGFPFVFGFSVYSSFESEQVAKTGIVPMPTKNDSFLGGHAVMAVGYNNATSKVKVLNSWGKAWGHNGYFYLPYAYITNPNLASDFWKIERVEG